MRRPPAALTAVACLTLLAVSCTEGNRDDENAVTTGATSTTEVTSTSTTTFSGTTTPVSVPATPPFSYLTGVRVAGHAGFDRIVFEFSERLPGYRVAYGDLPIHEDASGEEIPLAGAAAALEVRFEHAQGARMDGEEVTLTYTGKTRLSADTAAITEVVRSGDFEGVVSWAAGVRSRAPFRVSTLSSPDRLVVDIATTS